jgi:hypothetical protein
LVGCLQGVEATAKVACENAAAAADTGCCVSVSLRTKTLREINREHGIE